MKWLAFDNNVKVRSDKIVTYQTEVVTGGGLEELRVCTTDGKYYSTRRDVPAIIEALQAEEAEQ